MSVCRNDRVSVLVHPVRRYRRLFLLAVCGLLALAVLSGLSSVPQAEAQNSTIRVNAGGGAFTDTSGRAWSADTYYSGGTSYATGAAIANTNDDTLYQSVRYGNFSYNIPVSNGSYQVTLKFSEPYYTTAGRRVFNVALEGQTLISNLDVLTQVAGNTALDRSFTVNVSDGTLNIVFTSIVDNAIVNAIEVVPASTSSTVRVNAGGSAFTDTGGRAWSADTYYSGGTSYATGAAIANTNDDTLYQSVRYGNFSYNIPVSNGSYRVTLKFSEPYYTTAGRRVFNVALEGQTLISNLDVLTQVAGNTALDRSFTVNVSDGTLNIVFTSIVDNAIVNAIEVVPSAGATPAPTATPAPVQPTPTPAPAVGGSASYWGAYLSGAPWDMSVQDRFETTVGKRASLIPLTLMWKNGSGAYVPFQTTLMETIRQRGAIPVVLWGASNGTIGPNQPEFKSANVAAGAHDAYIRQFARDAKAWGKPFFLKLNPEMNGNWSWPWSDQLNGNQPGDFVRSWQHIRDIFTQEGVTNATWAWCPNVQRKETTSLQQVFPGANYVDWTCLHGYNWGYSGGRWLSFTDVYSGYDWQPYDSYRVITSLAPGKPVMLGEWATDEGDDGGPLKAAWIRDAFDVQIKTNYPLIRAIVWYNIPDGNERWPVESSTASLNQFKSSIGSSYYTANKYSNFWTSPIPGATP